MGRSRTSRDRGRRWQVSAAIGWLLLPAAQAHAHTTFPGLGEYASGFLHPLTTPPHLLVLLALGLWLGQHPPLRIKQTAAVFALVAAVGLLSTAITHFGGVYPALFIIIGLGVGASVAIGAPALPWVRLIVCGVSALMLGLDSGVDPGTPGASTTKILAATWVSLTLCLVNAAFYVSLLPAVRWARIGVRIVGSWIVAIAFLLLAFALRR